MPNEIENDTEIVSSLDQPMRYDPNPVLEDIGNFYNQAKNDGNLEAIIQRAQALIGNFRASGLGLAKLLYLLNRDWLSFKVDDEFSDTIFATLGIGKVTIDRYIAVWKLFAENYVPASMAESLKLKPMKSLIPIAKTLEQGYDITQTEWQSLMDSPDDSTIRGILRDLKGEPLRKGGMILVLKREGDIVATMNGQTVTVGYLYVDQTGDITEKSIERIVNGSGILKE